MLIIFVFLLIAPYSRALVPFTVDLIPRSNANRPGLKINGTPYITIHNTDDPSPVANARYYANLLKNTKNVSSSWHFTVDDREIIQHLATDEVGWHTNTKAGDMKSIGIKICENSGGDFVQAVRNTQELVSKLLKTLNIPVTRVLAHQQWSGKNCPHLLLKHNRWGYFLLGIILQQPGGSVPVSSSGSGKRRKSRAREDNGDYSCWGTVREKGRLRVQRRPNVHSSIEGHFERGQLVQIFNRTTGSSVSRSEFWFEVKGGFIPAYYVRVAHGSAYPWCVN